MREQAPPVCTSAHSGWSRICCPTRAPADQRLADSLGYVHAPSLQQATTAAVLRSGHLANREAAAGAFDIDLRSHRVKRAKRLLEGVANGQSMAALLGYRFERALRDNELSQHILDFRRAFPMKPSGPGPEVRREHPARDVVDGVRLIAEYREKGIDVISPATVPVAERPKVAPFIDDLIDLMDSVSDLLVAESVHQLVGGNLDGVRRGDADARQADASTRAPRVETPHCTRGYTQRVVVAMQTDQPARGPGADERPAGAGRAAPQRLAGAAARRPGALPLRRPRADSGGHRTQFDGRPVSLGATPATRSKPASTNWACRRCRWCWAASRSSAGGQSACRSAWRGAVAARLRALSAPGRHDGRGAARRCAARIRASRQAWARRVRVLLLAAAPPARQDPGLASHGHGACTRRHRDRSDAERRRVRGRRPGRFAGPARPGARSCRPCWRRWRSPRHPSRADRARDWRSTRHAPATQAMLAGLAGALAQAGVLGWRSALASQAVAAGASANGQGEQGHAGRHGGCCARARRGAARRSERPARRRALARRGRRLAMQVRKLRRPHPRDPRHSRSRCCRSSTLGAYAADAAPSLGAAQRAARTATISPSPAGCPSWAACARPPVCCRRTDCGRGPGPAHAGRRLQAAAGVHACAVKRWGALPPDPKDDLRGVVAVVAHAPGALARVDASRRGGRFVRRRVDRRRSPPTEETTGLSFHFDAPGARAPQSMLLAVPPTRPAELDARRTARRGRGSVVPGATARGAAAGPARPGLAAAGHLPVEQLQARRALGRLLEDPDREEPRAPSAPPMARTRQKSFMKMAAGTTIAASEPEPAP